MIIAAVTHGTGWREHAVVRAPVVRLGRYGSNPDVAMNVDDMIIDHDAQIGDSQIVLERYEDPVEERLIDACKADDDISRAVYADWLDERGHSARAELLRGQLEILRLPWTEPAHTALDLRMFQLVPTVPYGWWAHLDRPVVWIGERTSFAFAVGLNMRHHCRMIRVFAADHELNGRDKKPSAKGFASSVESDLYRVENPRALPRPGETLEANHLHVQLLEDEAQWVYRWMRWGSQLDPVSVCLFRADSETERILTIRFWQHSHPILEERLQTFTVRIEKAALVARMNDVIALLRAGEATR